MLQGVATLKLKDNLYSLSSLHTQSNKHIFWLWTQSVPHKNWMKDCAVRHWCTVRRKWEIGFHALFLCGLYFVQYGFIQVCIFYRFFWKTGFFIVLHFLCFLPVLCWMWLNLNKLYNICIVFVYAGVR